VLHQLLGDPRDIVAADGEVGSVRPKTGRAKSPVRTPCFAHAHHISRRGAIERTATFDAATATDFCEVSTYFAHAMNIYRL
jgi:hypothetical protein